MKTIRLIVVMGLLTASMASAAVSWNWSNGFGDRNFADGRNWVDGYEGQTWTINDRFYINFAGTSSPILNSNVTGENIYIANAASASGDLSITGGTSSFVSGSFSGGTGSNANISISGGTTTFSGYFTIGTSGNTSVTISNGSVIVNRSQLCQNVGSTGSFLISGGSFQSATYFDVSKGTGTITATGGTVDVTTSMTLGNGDVAGHGTVSVSGTAQVNVGGTLYIGDEGYGKVHVSGGSMTVNAVQAAFKAPAGSQGVLEVTNGEFTSNSYLTIGAFGPASLTLSGGVLNANRMTVGQETGSSGTVTLSGGQLNLDRHIELGRDGTATLTMQGNAPTVQCGSLEFGGSSTLALILNGAAGIGKGFEAFGFDDVEAAVVYDGDVLFHEGAKIDPSFATGTDTAGAYSVIVSSEPATYLAAAALPEDLPVEISGDISSMLSSAAATAGWTAKIIGAGSGSAVVLTSPVAGTSQVWNSGAATLNSALTKDYATVGSTAAATLSVSAGANGQFKNLTVADQGTSTGQIAMTGGTVNVTNAAIIGNAGNATLALSGGTFAAGHLFAASDAAATADIQVSGTAALNVNGALGLGAGAEMTVTGYQATLTAGNLSTAAGSNITFKLDGALGVGSGIVVAGNVVLKGTLTPEFIASRLDGVYTLIRAEGDIIVDNNDLLGGPFMTYEIVEDGIYNALKVTVFTPTSCQDVIDTGFTLAGDANKDCKVDLGDLAVMASQWLWCNDPTLPECDWMLQ